jgi:hypothetical protein
MIRATKRSGQVRRRFGEAALALALATVIGGAGMAPARADNDDGHHQRQTAHRDHGRGREQHRSYRDAAPVNVYAPPPVYYAPPSGPPAIDFVFPLRFR